LDEAASRGLLVDAARAMLSGGDSRALGSPGGLGPMLGGASQQDPSKIPARSITGKRMTIAEIAYALSVSTAKATAIRNMTPKTGLNGSGHR
jgi:hypothetical protein